MHECFHHWPYKAHPDSVAGIQKGIWREKYKKLKIDKANRSERKKFKTKRKKKRKRNTSIKIAVKANNRYGVITSDDNNVEKQWNRRKSVKGVYRGCGGGVARRAQKVGRGRCKIVPAAQSQEDRSWSPVCRTPAQHSLPFILSPLVRLHLGERRKSTRSHAAGRWLNRDFHRIARI